MLLAGDNLMLDAVGPTWVGMHGVWLDRYRAASTPKQFTPTAGVLTISALTDLPRRPRPHHPKVIVALG